MSDIPNPGPDHARGSSPGFDLPLAYRSERHAGMPALAESNEVSAFEYFSPTLFYAPLVGYMWWLALRYGGWLSASAVNPKLPNGGLWGESKTELLQHFGPLVRSKTAAFVTLPAQDRHDPAGSVAEARELCAAAGLDYPLVAKPDIGCRGAGVQVVENDAELAAYFENFPHQAAALLQRFVPWEGEAGVMFVRRPGQRRGEIFSLTLKYLPFVTGDGERTLQQLVQDDARAAGLETLYADKHREHWHQVVPVSVAVRLGFAGNHCRGAVFRDGREFVTKAMVDTFNDLADDLPEFHFGRFDVRFASLAALQRGEDFVIIEVNGGGAEATHIWDGRMRWREAYQTLAEQYRLLWAIGWNNRKRGFEPTPAAEQISMHLREKRLARLYPGAG